MFGGESIQFKKRTRLPDVALRNAFVIDTEDNKRAEPSHSRAERTLKIHSASEGQSLSVDYDHLRADTQQCSLRVMGEENCLKCP